MNRYANETPNLSGKQLSNKVHELDKYYHPIFSSTRYVGCQGTEEGTRGFTCGLWTLFHYLTVRAANAEAASDPLEVLQAIHGYVKHFFGCSDCAEHFKDMAKRKNIWQVASKSEAVLWLWGAHNEVNNRLAGDITEDPVFTKKQFPTEEMCPTCRIEQPVQNDNKRHEIDWNREEVLNYLYRIYSPSNISRFGLANEKVLTVPFEQHRAEERVYKPFSEIDIRMGLFLYAFCILIIVVAMKLFLQRGYRRKKSANDFVNKI